MNGVGDTDFTDFYWFETISVAIFTIEYSLRLWSVHRGSALRQARRILGPVSRYALTPVMLIDLVAFAPGLVDIFVPAALDLRILRLFRLLRLLKIARYSPALTHAARGDQSERRALFGTLLLIGASWSFRPTPCTWWKGRSARKFGRPASLYVGGNDRLAPIGYGDVGAGDRVGRLVAGITMILGLGLFALPVGIVATDFVTEIHRRDFVVTWGMFRACRCSRASTPRR